LFVNFIWDSADFGSRELVLGYDGFKREEGGERREERGNRED
jgi:hypothetical protein